MMTVYFQSELFKDPATGHRKFFNIALAPPRAVGGGVEYLFSPNGFSKLRATSCAYQNTAILRNRQITAFILASHPLSPISDTQT